MVESGTTITWEAWDQKYKPNQDWNHAWGAAPANLFPRYLLGVRPNAPGGGRVAVAPNIGSLTRAAGKIPTPRGPILVSWTNQTTFKLALTLPEGVSAVVDLPASAASRGVFSGERAIGAQREGTRWRLETPVSGTVELEVR